VVGGGAAGPLHKSDAYRGRTAHRPEILWSLSSPTPDEQWIEGLAMLVDGERNT
jgi:hypothetical protein